MAVTISLNLVEKKFLPQRSQTRAQIENLSKGTTKLSYEDIVSGTSQELAISMRDSELLTQKIEKYDARDAWHDLLHPHRLPRTTGTSGQKRRDKG